MFDLFGSIEEWIRDLLTGFISSNLTTMFTDVNDRTGTIAAEVGQTPQGWNSGIFSMIQSLSDSVIVPIAGLIITFVLCYELITMITERNNMHDMDTWMFFKWFFKAFIAVYLVTNTFTIVMAIFDVGQSLVSSAAGVIGGNTSIDITSTMTAMETAMESMDIGELLQLTLETALVSMCMKIISILITVTVKPVLGEKAAHNNTVVYSMDFQVTPHQLRHTYITNLIYAAVDPKTVQYLAGHENSKITMDIYAKVKYNRPQELAAVVNSAFDKG